ncbi:tripartite tricarboxylate transporter substrate binding protein [Cupriavidus gilardii]|uniref:tripartite tricarboxylate transporter substrate binding protein n=1 Tax=Cupriavidus gilardii TaxID=82541 RepID=UPI001EE597D9|nr:tripartite tricarboxylate transporter substrate binding protein [Cupriavidus gilardii]MCG5259266.1 tripartite tricarboxylate transporter substrate binding protein [Cupriavidus gilardii]
MAAGPAFAVDTAKFMIGANPGGGWDQAGRTLGAAMVSAGVAKSASYDNRGGAGGTIGLTQFVNTDKGNPNALLVTGAVMVGAIETNKPPVTLKNATPIARLFTDTMVITVPASSPIKSIKDLTAQLKANPGSVSWGGGSKGSIDHILAGLIAKDIGVDPKRINYVPFQGGGEASASVLGGHVTAGIAGVSEFLPFIKSGKMRALAVTSKDRVADIPTLKEQGVNVEIYNWRGVYGAPGITPEQRKALTDAVVKATESPAWKQALAKNDWTPFLLTGDEFGKFVDAESARLGAMLRELGVAK